MKQTVMHGSLSCTHFHYIPDQTNHYWYQSNFYRSCFGKHILFKCLSNLCTSKTQISITIFTHLEPRALKKLDKRGPLFRNKKRQITIGHVPCEISETLAFFMKHGSIVLCKVTSSQQRHSEIALGLEIPCLIRFTANTMIS